MFVEECADVRSSDLVCSVDVYAAEVAYSGEQRASTSAVSEVVLKHSTRRHDVCRCPDVVERGVLLSFRTEIEEGDIGISEGDRGADGGGDLDSLAEAISSIGSLDLDSNPIEVPHADGPIIIRPMTQSKNLWWEVDIENPIDLSTGTINEHVWILLDNSGWD